MQTGCGTARIVVIAMTLLLPSSGCGRDDALTAGFWFESVAFTVRPAGQTGSGWITPGELAVIEAIARAELGRAYAGSRMTVSDSRAARYQVRVVQDISGPGIRIPAAGASQTFFGSGRGVVNFSALASGAMSFAPPGSSRGDVIDAIGRGIGRTAAHEFAHQLLGSYGVDDNTDRSSYEYADLRAEHFYGPVHWHAAAGLLQQRIGLPRPAANERLP